MEATNKEEIKQEIITLEKSLIAAKRRLSSLEESDNKKQKINFISYTHSQNVDTQFIYKSNRDLEWPINCLDFKSMNNTKQDSILITLIESIRVANRKKGCIGRIESPKLFSCRKRQMFGRA